MTTHPSILTDAFRELRQAWWQHHLQEDAPERYWESLAEEHARRARNAHARQIYDQHTEAIIQGEGGLAIAPLTRADLLREQTS